jgi:hypothetical protein
MRRRTTFKPSSAERLEPRLALSQLAAAPAVDVLTDPATQLGRDRAASPHRMISVALKGTIEGRTPLDGKGTVSPMGTVTSVGTLSARGAEPVTYRGTLTLKGASGSITIRLFGRLFGPEFLGEKINLTYTITGGTRAFQGASGTGKAVFSPLIASKPGEFALTFGGLKPPPA